MENILVFFAFEASVFAVEKRRTDRESKMLVGRAIIPTTVQGHASAVTNQSMLLRSIMQRNFAIIRSLSSAIKIEQPAFTSQITDPLYRKLLYRSNHRGMVENEIILTSFIENNYTKLSESDVGLYERLLDEPDPSIYKWFTGSQEAESDYRHTSLLDSIRSWTRTMKKEA